MQSEIKCGLAVLAALTAFAFLSCSLRSTSSTPSRSAVDSGNGLREATRWATIASSQANPILKLLHLNYAVVTAKVAASDSVETQNLLTRLEALQSQTLKGLGKACPAIGQDLQVAKDAGWL